MFNLKNKKLTQLVCLCFLLLFFSGLVSALRPAYLNILKAPLTVLQVVSDELGAFVFYHRNFVASRNAGREIGALNQRLSALYEAALENARLRELLAFKQQASFKAVSGRVVARCPDSWSSCIIIDKGRKDGVRRGMPVVTYLGLCGRVVEVSAYASKALLVNDPNLNVSAVVQRSRQEGLISGTLGSQLIMRYLSEEADIKAQDVVVTSGLNSAFPKGLIIGQVTEIGREFSGLSRYALIKPAVCLACIEEVLIIVS